MDLLGLTAIVVLACACGLQSYLLARSRRRDSLQVRASVSDILTRLDEQGKRHSAESSTLRGELDRRLSTSADRSARTFAEISSRLALVDRAQKGIQDLSAEVLSLRQILSDRSARGAFGEVQLRTLLEDILPAGSYRMQCQLSNGKRADCTLSLPAPTGMIAIDSKFPFDNYRRMLDSGRSEESRRRARAGFSRDVKKHINDVAGKYIIPGETADSAVLFVPSEAVFAEIHGSCPQLVDLAHQRRVLLTSPTTLMAVLTTAAALLKDAALHEGAREIQGHLRKLAGDFKRFQDRYGKLASHIEMARKDVVAASVSAGKIAGRFERIDRLELAQQPDGSPLFGDPAASTRGRQD